MKIYISCLILLFISCTTAKKREIVEVEAPPPPEILFLNYKAYQSADGITSVILLSKIITNGRIKPESSMDVNPLSAWYCIQYDKNNKALDQKVIPNPLQPTVEFVNDVGELQTKTVAVDSIEFSIRLQRVPGTKSVVLVTAEKENKPIIKVDL